MSDLTEAQIEEALKGFVDPYLEENLVDAKVVKGIEIDGDKVSINVVLGFPAAGYVDTLKQRIEELLAKVDGVGSVEANVGFKISSHSVQKSLNPIEGVKNIIAVASGKGGVGKSTVSVNLALALSAEGARVGMLDADIYGPSQPRMLGMSGKPDSKDGTKLEPMINYDVQAMSIGFLIDEETPMIWRGPMVTQALEQLLKDTNWSDLDYLVIDLPPGTGDTQLTLAQKVPVSGAVVVTTPQDIALLDARKGLKMFQKVEVPVLGIVENMSTHICSNCGHEEHIFGEGGGQRMSEQYDVDFLGAIPLDGKIREQADGGKPTVVAEPDSRNTEAYKEIARSAAAKLSQKGKNYAAKFPKIVISNN